MEKLNLNTSLRVAGNLTISNWVELSKNLNYEYNDNWSLAFYFFEERIKTRYINPIKSILAIGDDLGEGFAVVNLQCSLIETIESFINGWKYNYKPKGWYKTNGQKDTLMNSNQDIFKSFFDKRKPFIDYEKKIYGEEFYQNVRCGLLHETQTKNNWKIKCDTPKSGLAYQEIKNGDIVEKIIYRENFQIDLEKLIALYKISIITGVEFDGISAFELRENFIAKFNHICKESTPK